jgi:hypothetical protein
MPLYSISRKERLSWGIITDHPLFQYLFQNILDYHTWKRSTTFEAQFNPHQIKSASTNPIAYLDFISRLVHPSGRFMSFISILATLSALTAYSQTWWFRTVTCLRYPVPQLQSSWNVMAHGDAREGK